MNAYPRWMIGDLQEVEEYFDQRADAEYHSGVAAPVGNEEMRLLGLVRDILREAER